MRDRRRYVSLSNAGATFREPLPAQPVDATLGQSLPREAYEAGFVRGDQIRQNKSPV
jgi:hypothetical protein